METSSAFLTPICQYTLRANERRPGEMYENLKEGFWKKFTDMGSAYLQEEKESIPKEFQGGTLFRFPLRETEKLSISIRPENLSKLMQEWIPSMRETMFFLNHVTEIKYIEISEDQFETKFRFKTEALKSGPVFPLHKAVSVKQHCQSHVQYELTLTEYDCVNKEGTPQKPKKQQWLIQQGIGDILDEGQHWQFIDKVKPRHAIAAPLRFSQDVRKWTGQLFCFLPLPSLSSEMPVHINGSFILDTTRRNLWASSDRRGEDDKSRWNKNLFMAVTSSYAHFLVQARWHYLKPTYTNWPQALEDLRNYYCLFPDVLTGEVKQVYKKIVSTKFTEVKKEIPSVQVYEKLVKINAEVLCVLVSHKGKVSVEWHPLISKQQVNQVYFWSHIEGADRKVVHPILESIGMKITSAPPRMMETLDCVIVEESKLQNKGSSSSEEVQCRLIPPVSPHSVFKYYTELSQFSSSRNMKECLIEKTEFKDAKGFLLFIKYLLGMRFETKTDPAKQSSGASAYTHRVAELTSSENEDADDTKIRTFPLTLFSHFLLLSADETLKVFDEKRKFLTQIF